MFTIKFSKLDVQNLNPGMSDFVTMELWRCFTSITTEGVATEHAILIESKSFQSFHATDVPVIFNNNPDMEDEAEFIAITAKAIGTNGFWFKSGKKISIPFEAPSNPDNVINIALLGTAIFSNSDIILPSVPFSFRIDSIADMFTSGSITFLSASLNNDGNLSIVITGTLIPTMAGPTVTFSNRYTLSIKPNVQINEVKKLIDVQYLSDTGVTWSAMGMSTGVTDFITNFLFPCVSEILATSIISSVESKINKAVITQVNSNLSSNDSLVSILPDTININIINITPQQNKITFEVAISSFGYVLNKLFKKKTKRRKLVSKRRIRKKPN